MSKRRRRNHGFTLIELMVVVTILGILASLTSVAVMRYLKEARIDTTKATLRMLMSGINMHQMRKSKLPERLEDLVGSDPDTRFIDSETVPRDAWNNEFIYERQGKTYILKSLGADGVEGGEGEDEDIDKESLTRVKTDEE
jgi:general secretion pathway protein G